MGTQGGTWPEALTSRVNAPLQVGILDVDLCGPSVPRMLRVQGRAVHQGDSGWVPVFVDREQSISLMSVGFLLEQPDEAVVWRGPKKNGNATPGCRLPTRPATSGAGGKTGAGLHFQDTPPNPDPSSLQVRRQFAWGVRA